MPMNGCTNERNPCRISPETSEAKFDLHPHGLHARTLEGLEAVQHHSAVEPERSGEYRDAFESPRKRTG